MSGLAVGGGCYTSAQTGQELLERVAALEAGQQELSQGLDRAQEQLASLEDQLVERTRIATRSSADAGAQVETLEGRLASLRGELAELRNELQRQQTELREQQTGNRQQLEKIARHVGVDMALDESQIPEDADAHFAAAERSYDNSELSRARALYRAFLQRYPDDERADDAQYKVGASYLREERPATALGELRQVLTEHRDGDRVDDALADMAEAFWQLHSCEDAEDTLRALLQAHPRSPRTREARQLLTRVRRPPAGYCRN
ncbi:MAG: hypothetical protein ACFCGT_18505 [Sandaracinaceae bacterium]